METGALRSIRGDSRPIQASRAPWRGHEGVDRSSSSPKREKTI